MINVYIYKVLPSTPHIPMLYFVFGSNKPGNQLFIDNVFKNYNEKFFNIVQTAEDADFIIIPHIHRYLERKEGYLEGAQKFSIDAGKPLLLFMYGDDDAELNLKNTIVFRYSQYRYRKKPYEIIVPLFAANGSEEIEVHSRSKTNLIPTVGFCGWSDYKNLTDALKAGIGNFFWVLLAVVSGNPAQLSRRKGIYFRKKVLEKLEKSDLLKCSFVKRASFSAHKKTISVPLENARTEFLLNITDNDFSLAIRGDGNASIRFYEILSLGRIPVLIDTDNVLPLENIINYEDFCLVVPFSRVNDLDKIIFNFYNSLTNYEFTRKQEIAKRIFDTYLESDKFYRYIFKDKETLLQLVTL